MLTNRISLRKINLGDTDNIVSWRNKNRVRYNLINKECITKESHINYFHKYIESGKVIQFVIQVIEKDDVIPIGTTLLKNIDNDKKSCEIGLFIGDDNYLGKGLGKESVNATVDYAFKHLHMNQVYLYVYSNNLSAISTYEKCGFIKDISKGNNDLITNMNGGEPLLICMRKKEKF